MRIFLEAIKKISILVAALLIAGFIGNLLIDNPYIHGFLRQEINRKLEEYTFLSLKFEAINAKFLPLGFDIYGIKVEQKQKTDVAPLFQAMHLQIRVSLIALLLSKRELLEIEVNAPKLEWPLPPLEELLRLEKFPDLQKPSGSLTWPLDLPMPFHKVSWTNASLLLRLPAGQADQPDALALKVDGFDLTFSYISWQNFDVQSEIRHLNLSVQGASLLQDVTTQLLLHQRRDHLTAERFEISGPELEASSKFKLDLELGKKSIKSGPIVQEIKQLLGLKLQLQSEVKHADIAILGRFLRTDATAGPLQGQLTLDLELPFDGREPSWKVGGHGRSQQARLAGFKLLDSDLDFKINAKGVSFDHARLLDGEQVLARGKGFLGFDAEIPFAYTIEPVKLLLHDLLNVLQVDDFQALQTQLVADSIHIKGQGFPFSMKIAGLVTFRDVTLPLLKELPQRFVEAPSCTIDTVLSVDDKAVSIDKGSGSCVGGDARGETLKSPISLAGFFGFTTQLGMEFQLQSNELRAPLLDHFTKIPATGLLASRLSIKGPYDKLVIGGEMQSHELGFGGFVAKALQTEFQYPLATDTVMIQRLRLTDGAKGTLQLKKASFGMHAPYQFDAEIEASELSPEFFRGGLRQLFKQEQLSFGVRAFQGHLSGDLLRPFAYQGKAHFVLKDFHLDDETFFDEASGTLIGTEPLWSLQGAYFRLSQIEARMDLDIAHRPSQKPPQHIFHELGISPNDRLHVAIKTLNKTTSSYRTNDVAANSNHLASLPYIGPMFKAHKFGGEIQLDADLEGPIDNLQGKIEGALEQPFVWGIPISSFYFSGFLDGLKLKIPEFRHSGNSLVGRINIDFGHKGLPYDWYLYLNQLDIRAVLTEIFANDPRNFAYLSAEWTMKGHLKDFWGSSGDLILSRVRSRFFRDLGSRTSSIELNSDQPIRVQISPEQWRLTDKRPLKLKGEYFDLELSAGDNRLPEHLDLSLQGSIKLDILKNFTHLAETARGEVLVEGFLRGPLSKPDLSVRFRERKMDPFNMKEWTPVSIGLVDYGPALTAVSFDVELKGDRVVVHQLHANKGREGNIDVKGVLSFGEANSEQTRLLINLDRIEMNRLTVPVLKNVDLVVSGDLILSGNRLPLSLTGNFVIDRFYSLGNFDLRREIVSSLYETRLSASGAGGEQARPMLNLDVGVTADKSILIKSKSLEATLSANLRVRGTELQPLLLGQIIADRGSFNYRRLFKINQAVISFDEPVSPPNPRLDIIGETTVNPYQVQVLVNGDLANPRVTLTSDPPNREDGSPISNLDIVLLITTGKIPEQANKTAEKASVNEIFSSFLVFAEEPIEKLFDLSGQTVIREVYIDSYLSEAEQRPITRLNVPFNLWGMANAVVQVDDESNTKLSFEYPLHEGITLSGSLDRKTNKQDSQESPIPKDTGFDLKFRFGFD